MPLLCFNLQVVAVAAGFDTRAYRFAPKNGSVSFFEVCVSQVLDMLHKPCDRRMALDQRGISIGSIVKPQRAR